MIVSLFVRTLQLMLLVRKKYLEARFFLVLYITVMKTFSTNPLYLINEVLQPPYGFIFL